MDETRQRGGGGEGTGGSPADRLEVVAGWFRPEAGGDGVQLTVIATGVMRRAMPLLARVGEQTVRDLMLSPMGFSGRLERRPRDGDRLFVRWADRDEQPTPVVYGEAGVA
jgi:hypothetical protein